MPGDYDLYVSAGLGPLQWNALTIGSQNPMVVIGSPLLSQLGVGEQRAVIGHELGHILSDHVLYMTALQILLQCGRLDRTARDYRCCRSGRSCSNGSAPLSSAATVPPRSPFATRRSSAGR